MSGATRGNRPTRSARADGIRALLVMVTAMWLLEVVDSLDDHRLDSLGIEPRDADGLLGIVCAPFLHAGFGHLVSNTIPLVAMGLGIALAGAVRVVSVTAVVAAVSGIGTWLTAPAGSTTIGASGIVFGYATYLVSRGVFTRRLGDIGLGLLVVVLYGGALLGSLVPREGISWQAHLFGAIGGVLAARYLAPARRAPKPGQPVVRDL